MLGLTAVLWLVAGAGWAEERDRIADARRLYNQELYELAIRAASEARDAGHSVDEASLIIARAHLERYRQTRDSANLAGARDALRALDPSRLEGTAHTEFTLALGEWLFLDERYGAAAELFDAALGSVEALGPDARDRALDWWATAVDRQAQIDPANRAALYRRIVERMEEELRRVPGSTAAGYWLPAAARSLGDVDRAWHAAIAGYLRARIAPDKGAALRADLDRLMTTAIIPERARRAGPDPAQQKAEADALTEEWETIKRQWR
ncbi:MAG TPA: hypothetical protein VIL25_03300 [Vicinamibacterales bacterium]